MADIDHNTPPAERLREAARILRERATAATPPVDPYAEQLAALDG